MNPDLLPEDLRDDRRLRAEVADYPIRQVNPVTGYRTVLYRSGTDVDFLGWIELVNEDRTAGYIYIRRPVQSCYLGLDRYVVMDVVPELLESLMRILQSGEPLQLKFFHGAAELEPAAFLMHRVQVDSPR